MRLALRASVLLATFIASSVQAGFFSNYTDWQKHEPYGQAMYVEGLFDAAQNDTVLDEIGWLTARRHGTHTCFYELHLTAPMLADAVTKHYQANVGDWVLPPAVVFTELSRRICITYINQELAKAGIPAWKPNVGPILAKFQQ